MPGTEENRVDKSPHFAGQTGWQEVPCTCSGSHLNGCHPRRVNRYGCDRPRNVLQRLRLADTLLQRGRKHARHNKAATRSRRAVQRQSYGPSHPGAGISTSTRLSAYLEDFFRSLGVAYERQAVADKRDNIVAVFEPAGATSTLIYEVHQDTVPTDHMTIDPFQPPNRTRPALRPWGLRRQGRHGRHDGSVRPGCSPARAVSDLCLLAPWTRSSPSSAFSDWCTTTCAAATGPDRFRRRRRADLSGHRPRAQGGSPLASAATTGRSCHSSRPELGVNAIYHMANLLPLVERYADELRTASRTHCSDRRRSASGESKAARASTRFPTVVRSRSTAVPCQGRTCVPSIPSSRPI